LYKISTFYGRLEFKQTEMSSDEDLLRTWAQFVEISSTVNH
jgi:hypothetical protein